MFFRRRHAMVAALAGLALTLSACSGSGDSGAVNEQGFPEKLTLAAIPAENSTDLKASYDPLIALLEKETGSEVDFVQASDYAGVVEGMIAGNVDLAFFGPFAYVVAGVNGAQLTPLGAGVQEKGGASRATSPTGSRRPITRPCPRWRISGAGRCASSTPVRRPDSCIPPPG